MISHLVFSLFIELETPNKSSIKFGSYDVEGLKDGAQLHMFKTLGNLSW